MTLRRYLAVIALFVAVPAALAHVPLVEEQVTYAKPWKAPASADASWEAPFWLPYDVRESQAIFAYLSPGDQDVFAFTVQPWQLGHGPVVVAASALPPACGQTKEHFPVTALVGPIGPTLRPPVNPEALPFVVPPGMGVAFAPNPRPEGGSERPVFSDPNLGLSWFLPLGLTQECLFNAPWACDYTNTISVPVFVPGTYYLVMWDPDGVPQDYTANIGFLESGLPPDPSVIDLVKDNGWLHHPCTPPYPGR
jgi:hypothetical protein